MLFRFSGGLKPFINVPSSSPAGCRSVRPGLVAEEISSKCRRPASVAPGSGHRRGREKNRRSEGGPPPPLRPSVAPSVLGLWRKKISSKCRRTLAGPAVADSGRRQGARRLVAEKISDTCRRTLAGQPALRSRIADGDKARGGLWRKKISGGEIGAILARRRPWSLSDPGTSGEAACGRANRQGQGAGAVTLRIDSESWWRFP